jgi:hypothetical protein
MSDMSPSRSITPDHLAEHVARLALPINEPLVHYLVVGRELCRDLESLLILLVIIQRANRHPDFARLAPAELAAGRVRRLPALAANLQSISESTGIPRETVRRKVCRLVEIGWVAREGANLRFTPEGYCRITPLRDAASRMAASITDAVNRALAEEPLPPKLTADAQLDPR